VEILAKLFTVCLQKNWMELNTICPICGRPMALHSVLERLDCKEKEKDEADSGEIYRSSSDD